MAELKTQQTRASVTRFINNIENEQRRNECKTLLKFFKEVTGEKPAMWGDSIVGFGKYHYVYPTGNSGDWLRCGFSPRKQALTIYLLGGVENEGLLKKLGKHKTGKSCLYVKNLDDIDLATLKKLVAASNRVLTGRYGTT